ncbi:response regulator transcription factor [Mucilaginibacter sp. KACC 22063]|uniref:response regulator transcription factor n=1 Tax=Mucilaginibacter sp. KACC 22063 TaxID=3025666 RepID=UPI0023668F3C|nr:response regulator [Mucilaginibacter sp. KACC 22063]WDF53986.1 response regulator [Mucilaginibacter sp. KACC 22063]
MKPVILLVDDNEEILSFISDDLEETYEVRTATNGFDALKALEQEPVQLVITDIMMPEMDGFELCQKLKSDIHYSHIPVILLTAKNTLQSKIDGLEFGADAYIDKPFSPKHLQAQIANLLKNRDQMKAYFASSPIVHIKTMAYSKADESFLEKLNEIIHQNITNVNLDVEHLADIMNMSRPTLYRKIKSISDLTPNELINIARLKKAAELLSLGDYKIFEIAEMVGYTSQTVFGRNFQKQFGMAPTDYLNQIRV